MIETTLNIPIPDKVVENYFKTLVNRFFKILPIKESEELTLSTYIQSFQVEMLGCKKLISMLNNDSNFLTLLSILQYLRDNPQCPIIDVRREVFRAISICNKLKTRYLTERTGEQSGHMEHI